MSSHPNNQSIASNADACAVELLRVTLLSLEGIELSEETLCPNEDGRSSSRDKKKLAAVSNDWRITAWAGFRSSFPTGCLSVPTSHYSSIFEKEGYLLAVESDQIELDNTSSSSLGESGPVGRVHWQDDSVQCDERQPNNDAEVEQLLTSPQHHLQVTLPPQQIHSDTTTGCDELMLPDIIEIHVCIACILINPQSEDSSDEWTREEHFCHGVAHIKIPSREQSSTVDNLDLSGFSRPGGKVVMLPIRTKPPISEAEKIFATFVNNAILSLRVEKMILPKEQFNECKEEQQHYIKSDWNGENCAPASINSFESQGKGKHIVRAGQIISSIRQTLSSQISNLRKSEDEGEQLYCYDLVNPPKMSFSELLEIGCGELGDVLQGDEIGMYDHIEAIDSSIATADAMDD
ncbi:hypothetical protein ACHAXM_008546 [Skeletonema potamos]